MSSLEHIILYLLMFSLFCIVGKDLSQTQGRFFFWAYAASLIAVYSVVTGMRYGWGPDYLSYKERYLAALTYDEEQVGFRLLNQIMHSSGLGYVGAFVLYSAILVVAIFVLLRSYRRESYYMYSFLVPAILLMVTNTIRQGVALSFVFLAIYFFDKKRWVQAAICVVLGSMIHTSVYITAAMILGAYLVLRTPITWKITVPLYLFFTFIYDVGKTAVLANYVQKIQLDSKFQSYIETSDQWFGKDAVNSIYQQGTLPLILSSLFHCALIYLGWLALQKKPNLRIAYIYNAMVFGLILYRAVFLFEILRRFAEPLVALYFIVAGYIWYVSNKRDIELGSELFKSIDQDRWKWNLGKFLIMLYLVFFWGRFVFLNPTALFFWDIA